MPQVSVPLLYAAPDWKPALSEYVILWHGCTALAKNGIEAGGIDLTRCAVDTDFGRGFYFYCVLRLPGRKALGTTLPG